MSSEPFLLKFTAMFCPGWFWLLSEMSKRWFTQLNQAQNGLRAHADVSRKLWFPLGNSPQSDSRVSSANLLLLLVSNQLSQGPKNLRSRILTGVPHLLLLCIHTFMKVPVCTCMCSCAWVCLFQREKEIEIWFVSQSERGLGVRLMRKEQHFNCQYYCLLTNPRYLIRR